MTLNCSSFVYYSWKSLFLQNILKCAEEQTSSLKINTGIKSLPQRFEKEMYQYVNIPWLFFVLTGKHVCWSPFLVLSIGKFLRAFILKNIREWLLLKLCS